MTDDIKPPEGDNGSGNPPENDPPKTFTQDELNSILAKEKRKEEAKYAEYRRKAAEYDKLQEASKTELQKLQDKYAAAEKRAAALEAERDLEKWRAKYGREAGIPEADWDRLRGTTEDEIAEDAKEWAKSRGLNKAGGPTPPGGSAPTGNEFNRMVLRAAGRGGR